MEEFFKNIFLFHRTTDPESDQEYQPSRSKKGLDKGKKKYIQMGLYQNRTQQKNRPVITLL